MYKPEKDINSKQLHLYAAETIQRKNKVRAHSIQSLRKF